MRYVVVDTDTGIDDAVALLFLCARPEVEVVAVGTTHGNCTTARSTANALRVLEAAGCPGVPVAHGLDAPLAQPLDVAWYVHGRDGLGDVDLPPARTAPSEEGAVEQLVRLGRERPGELDLLALGPLTNLAAALRQDREALARYRTVTIMGGTGLALVPGDEDPWAEIGDPNTYHDGLAAEIVAAAEARVTLVGVDVTMDTTWEAPDLDRLEAAARADPTGSAAYAVRFLPFYVDFYARRFGRRAMSLHDPLAAAVLLDPSLVTVLATGVLTVEPDAQGRARASLQQRPPVEGERLTTAVLGVDRRLAAEAVLRALDA